MVLSIFVGLYTHHHSPFENISSPWLVWLSGLSTGLQTERLPVRGPVRTHAWIAGQVPIWEVFERQLIDVSLPLSLPPLTKNK